MIKINFKKLNFWLIACGMFLVILGITSLILLASKSNPTSFFSVIFAEPWKNLNTFSSLVFTFSLLLLIGLAVGITFRYRIYNLGVPGQMMFSASTVYVLAVAIANVGGKSRAISVFLLIIAILVGVLSGLIVAILKTYFRVNEIISTILFNFIAWEGYNGLISSKSYQGLQIPSFVSLRFSILAGPMSASNLFSWVIIIAVVVLIITILLFSNRTLGFKLNSIAKNPVAAKQARMDPKKQTLIVLPISAGIAGIAGYIYFLGNNNTLPELSFIPQEGLYGISVACLAFYQPVLMIFSALLISFFIRPIEFNSFIYMNNQQLATILIGVFIYLLAFIPFLWQLWDNSPFIEEKIYLLKRKLFSITKKDKPPELIEDAKEQKVHFISVNKTKGEKFKMWFIKLFKKKDKDQGGKE